MTVPPVRAMYVLQCLPAEVILTVRISLAPAPARVPPPSRSRSPSLAHSLTRSLTHSLTRPRSRTGQLLSSNPAEAGFDGLTPGPRWDTQKANGPKAAVERPVQPKGGG
jgi:hypothetical protein